jgi:hypothetical protein
MAVSPMSMGPSTLSYLKASATRTVKNINYTIAFGPTPALHGGKTYWIGVQAVADYATYNDFFWRDSSPQRGNPAHW